VAVRLAEGRQEFSVSASFFRQDQSSQFLIRFAPLQASSVQVAVPQAILRVVESAPDGFVVTDPQGFILTANRAFIDLTQLAAEDQVRGESLERWIGRSSVDFNVLIATLRQHGAVRLFATAFHGDHGFTTDVEISAVAVPHGEQPCLGFAIRNVGRRLTGDPKSAHELPRSAEQLTELVGRVPLKDLVGETTDLIEKLCIEAALELTRDNRAAAAEMLGLSRQSLYVKLRRYGLGDLPPEAEE
jgi:transcriptional regulator PpsR